LIVGAKISGLTLAIALRLKGIIVDVAEIKEDVSEQLGVGLSLQGNALAAFGKAGLSRPILKVAVPGCYLNIRKPNDVFRRPPRPLKTH
jgi:2-polyprenyl-6-methoxyphenol hydroxylase-like FAD-dependent oxidoreductase